MRSLMICAPQIKKNELGGARSTYGGDETYIQGSGGEAWRKETIWKTQTCCDYSD